MKFVFYSLLTLLIFASCGKYERPFFSFLSPEKRLTKSPWSLEKFIRGDGSEGTSNEMFEFTINGNDSIYKRTIDGVVYTGNWTWRPGLKNKLDKQKIIVNIEIPSYTVTRIIYDIKVLTSKKLEMIDMNGPVTGNYRYFLKR